MVEEAQEKIASFEYVYNSADPPSDHAWNNGPWSRALLSMLVVRILLI